MMSSTRSTLLRARRSAPSILAGEQTHRPQIAQIFSDPIPILKSVYIGTLGICGSKFAIARTPSPARETRALPSRTQNVVDPFDFAEDKTFHAGTAEFMRRNRSGPCSWRNPEK